MAKAIKGNRSGSRDRKPLSSELREILKTRQNSDCVYRDFLAYAVAALQPRKYYKGLVRSIVGIVPRSQTQGSRNNRANCMG